MNFIPRFYAASGSLTAGTPAAQYPAGSYQFRTPFLVLVLEPIVDNAAFVAALNRAIASRIAGASLRSGSIGVSAPFQQSVDRNEAGLLDRSLTQDFPIIAAGSAAAAATSVPGMAIGGASFLGWLIGTPLGAIASRVIPDHVPARWVTVTGTIDSPASPVTTDVVTQAIAAALDETMRFRVPQPPYQVVAPQAWSIVARTRETGACSGHVRSDKVIAAACTRLEPTAPPPRAASPAVQQAPVSYPSPVAYPPDPASHATATAKPTAQGGAASTPYPTGPAYASPPPDNGVSPWWYAAGALLVMGAAALIITDD